MFNVLYGVGIAVLVGGLFTPLPIVFKAFYGIPAAYILYDAHVTCHGM